jgi:hypothetical protein
VLADDGAVDLVLHGHTHQPYHGPLLPPPAPRPWVYECGSSTYLPSARRRHGKVARYNVYELAEDAGGRVRLRTATARVYDPATGTFSPQPLPVPPTVQL